MICCKCNKEGYFSVYTRYKTKAGVKTLFICKVCSYERMKKQRAALELRGIDVIAKKKEYQRTYHKKKQYNRKKNRNTQDEFIEKFDFETASKKSIQALSKRPFYTH